MFIHNLQVNWIPSVTSLWWPSTPSLSSSPGVLPSLWRGYPSWATMSPSPTPPVLREWWQCQPRRGTPYQSCTTPLTILDPDNNFTVTWWSPINVVTDQVSNSTWSCKNSYSIQRWANCVQLLLMQIKYHCTSNKLLHHHITSLDHCITLNSSACQSSSYTKLSPWFRFKCVTAYYVHSL